MTKFITLSKIKRESDQPRATAQVADQFTNTDDPTENGNVIALTPEAPAVLSDPTMVNVDSIRCFYPRRHGNPGCRLTFTDGGGFAVTESFETIQALVNG